MKKLVSLVVSHCGAWAGAWIETAAALAVTAAVPGVVRAEWSGATTFLENGGRNAEGAANSVVPIVMNALLAVFFLGGAILVGMGVFAFANKDQNPQHAQGAWKKVVAGGALLAFTVLLGILKSTIYSGITSGTVVQ